VFHYVADGASIMAARDAVLGAKMIGIAEQDGGPAGLYLSERDKALVFGWAQIWRFKYRDADLKCRLLTTRLPFNLDERASALERR
jgi:predicted metalloendopeptidase